MKQDSHRLTLAFSALCAALLHGAVLLMEGRYIPPVVEGSPTISEGMEVELVAGDSPAESMPEPSPIAVQETPTELPVPPEEQPQEPQPEPEPVEPPPIEDAVPLPVEVKPEPTPQKKTAPPRPSSRALAAESGKPPSSAQRATGGEGASAGQVSGNQVSYLFNPRPAYPRESRKAGEQGTVLLNVQLDERGQILNASIQNGSGYPRLDAAALESVRKWRFRPARQGGKTIQSQALIPIRFSLNDA